MRIYYAKFINQYKKLRAFFVSIIKKYSALFISLSVFWITVISVYFISISSTGGVFFYTLDDAYIHMAMAKNFSLYGVWGITKYEFTSCSSSPLWTVLLSGLYFIFGVRDSIPLLLNILFSSFTALVVSVFIRKFTGSIIVQLIVLLFILFFSPFVSVVFTGLEHSMQSFFIVLCVYYLYEVLSSETGKINSIMLPVSVMLLTASRYEGMFAAAGIFLVLVLRKRYLTGIMVISFSFLPVLIAGLVSVAQGWYFFPNSVLLKSTFGSAGSSSVFSGLFNPHFFQILWAYKRILLLLILPVVLIFITKKDDETSLLKSIIFVFVLTVIMQINFAKLGSLLRYEMYIMTFGILLNSIIMVRYLKEKSRVIKTAAYLFITAVSVLFSISTINAAEDVPLASRNIYHMQYQMSRFINKYYKDAHIALNDIGAVNYYCDIHCLDMWGLADREVAELRRAGRYNTEEINRINRERKTEIVIIFDSWFEQYGGLPKYWYNSGTWRIQENITCGSDVISFYALEKEPFLKLDDNMWEFNSELNEKVLRYGEFIDRRVSF